MSENEYKELNAVHLDTVKELSRIVKEQAQIGISKHDTCCKYITILVIAIALFATIALCCIFEQRNSIPDTKPCICSISSSSVTEEK